MPKKDFYQRMKAEHRCVSCGKQDARTLNGRVHCDRCYGMEREYRKKNKEMIRHQISVYTFRQYYKRLENHECVGCGAKLPKDYYFVRCETCRAKQKEYKQKAHHQKKKTAKRGNA